MSILRAGICSALTPEVQTRLKDAGIRTVTDFLIRNLEEISQKVSLPFTDLAAIRRVLLAEYAELPDLGSNLYKTVLSSAAVLSTGHNGLNQLLDGGLYTGEVTELIGETASGKTKLCFTCAATLVEETNVNIVYLDTGGAFSGEDLLDLLPEDDEVRQDGMLSRIWRIPVHDIFEVFQALEDIRSQLTLQVDNFFCHLKLVVLDSVAAVALPLFGSQLIEGLGLLTQLGHKLKVMASHFTLAVLMTNHVRQSDDGQITASLGRAWSHVPHTRVLVQRVPNTHLRRCTLVKSSRKEILASTQLNFHPSSVEDSSHHS